MRRLILALEALKECVLLAHGSLHVRLLGGHGNHTSMSGSARLHSWNPKPWRAAHATSVSPADLVRLRARRGEPCRAWDIARPCARAHPRSRPRRSGG